MGSWGYSGKGSSYSSSSSTSKSSEPKVERIVRMIGELNSANSKVEQKKQELKTAEQEQRDAKAKLSAAIAELDPQTLSTIRALFGNASLDLGPTEAEKAVNSIFDRALQDLGNSQDL